MSSTISRFPSREAAREPCAFRREIVNIKRVLDTIENYAPVYPKEIGADAAARSEFLRELFSRDSGPIELISDRKGFLRPGLFLGHGLHVRDGELRQPPNPHETFGPDLHGRLMETHCRILSLAEVSDYLAFGIGIALAAPLQAYVQLYGSLLQTKRLMPEGAIFLFKGKSASGKTSLERACLSLGGSPERMIGFDFTPRGLAEFAADNNDHLTVIDDTERSGTGQGELIRALKAIIHQLPAGRSRQVSGASSLHQAVRWNTLVMASTPTSVFELAEEHGWTPSQGDRARIFEIAVPGLKRGGIFNRIPGGAARRALLSPNHIQELEKGYSNNCGYAVPSFVHWLMKKNRVDQVLALTEEFVGEVAGDQDGWEQRFARKFGVVYAACVLANRANILRWPDPLAMRAVKHCYRKARSAAQTDEERAHSGLELLSRELSKPDRVAESGGQDQAVEITGKTIAISFRKAGEPSIGILDAALNRLMRTSRAKRAFIRFLLQRGLLGPGHGHAGTTQERIRVNHNGRVTNRVRLWVLKASTFH